MLIKRNNKEQYSTNLTTKALESHTGKPVQLKIQLKSRNIQNRIDVYNLQLTSNHPELQFRHHSFDLARNIFYRVLNVPYVATQLESIYIILAENYTQIPIIKYAYNIPGYYLNSLTFCFAILLLQF